MAETSEVIGRGMAADAAGNVYISTSVGRTQNLSYNRVMIAKDLLEILVCPACKMALEYRQNPESLKCTQCRRVYAVKDDIPIMLVDEATIEP